MIELTTIGIVFLICIILTLPFGSSRLLYLLVVFSIFDASAIANITSSGQYNPITPYYFLIIVIIAFLIIRRLKLKRVTMDKELALFCVTLIIFTTLTVIGAVFLPRIFQGVEVLSPQGSLDPGKFSPLAPSLSNFAQSGYLILNVVLLVLIFVRPTIPITSHGLVKALNISAVLVILIGFYQLIAYQANLPYPVDLLYSASGRAQHFSQGMFGFKRINSTFIEPSHLGGYVVSYLSFATILWLEGHRSRFQGTLIIGSLMLAIVTTSTTAYLGVIGLLLFIVPRYFLYPFLTTHKIRLRTLLLMGGSFAIFLTLVVTVLSSSKLFEMVLSVTLEKSESTSYIDRTTSFVHGLKLVPETFGLGVGLGSARPSSFLAFLLANTGLLGFLIFSFSIILLYQNVRRQKKSLPPTSFQRAFAVATSWGLGMYLFEKMLVLPDLSSGILWVWILSVMLGCVEAQRVIQRKFVAL